MPSLGGSIFTHNVLKFDYCIREALASLSDACDEVVVMDAESDDGTIEALQEIASRDSKIRLVTGAKWEVGTKYDRLAILANQAASYLTTDWHFMLQADEVIHESSLGTIRSAISNAEGIDTFAVRRFNLYGDFGHHVSLTSNRKPCNDTPVRLGRRGIPAIGDAESLHAVNCCGSYAQVITLFHYGYVRKSASLFEKTIDMQSWFDGAGSQPDQRIVEMKKEGVFDPCRIIPRSELVPNTMTHPKYMTQWIKDREADQATWVKG